MTIRLLIIGWTLVCGLMPAAAVAAGDPTKGKALFVQCMACHSVDRARKSGIGPNLFGVVGRPVASIKGFAYSPALSLKKGTWTPPLLDAFVAAPAKAVPGGRMPYVGMRSPTDRQNLIAYLVAVSK